MRRPRRSIAAGGRPNRGRAGATGARQGAVAAEREDVLTELHSERCVDCAPAQGWATLLDEGRYLASERTMYRLLAARYGGVSERRDQLCHPSYAAPGLLAEQPNEVWSWDISKLKGPAKWTHYYLYVILDVFSRYAVGWTVQHRESSPVAKDLIVQVCQQQQIARDQLTIHADHGSSMTSKPVAVLLADSASSRRTTGPTPRPTTPTARRSARRSSTSPGSRGASTPSSTPAASAATSSTDTTTSTATAASA